MTVRELIKLLLYEDMESEVIVRTADRDSAEIDGIEPTPSAEYNGYCALSTDIPLIRK